ncbi:MAG TPA: hypothetical protein VGS20_02735 [Candidatus Acidoferrales bacterium]|nr:hypothetical protein [Candidatus Acidoferrales bacterium]
MKALIAVTLAALMGCAQLAALAQQPQQQKPAAPVQQKQPAPAAPPGTSEPPLVTTGRVGDSNYGWTNGRAWFTLDDTAKVAMVMGIEQGLILAVRENWNSVPKPAQSALTDTAVRLTVSGVSFNDMVEQMNEFYLDAANIDIPVVDVYLYEVMVAKKTPAAEVTRFLEGLRKAYNLPPMPTEAPKKP